VVALSDVAGVSAGQYHTLVLKTDGSVWAFGANSYGQLGDQTTTLRTSPVAVKLADGAALTGVVTVAAGSNHSLALKSDGTVVAWGYNSNGQLGDTTTTQRTSAVPVKLLDGTPLTGVIAIAAGGT
jgi:alpha-tubulin suppressor-like RCC1 family protein